VLVLTQCLSSP